MPSYEPPDKKKKNQNLADVLRSKLGYNASHSKGKAIGDFNATHVHGKPIGEVNRKQLPPQLSPKLLEALKRKVAGPTSVTQPQQVTTGVSGRSSVPATVTPTKPTEGRGTTQVPLAPVRGTTGRNLDPGFYRDDKPRKPRKRNPSSSVSYGAR